MRPDTLVRCALLGASLAVFGPGTGHSQPGTPFAEGKAYDRESGELLYREEHLCELSGRRCSVHYLDPTGTLIASKEIDYRKSMTSPALTIRDYRDGQEFRLDPADGSIVVDAGFDNFVREQWRTLMLGDPVYFRFQIAGFDSPLEMNIVRRDQPGCSGDELCLSVNFNSWLLGAFVSPIELSYARGDRKLLRYSGISNLRDGTGELMDVDIRYEYADPEPVPEKSNAVLFQL